MGGIFDLEGPLMQALGKAADLLVLSLLWLLGCLPLITVGTSTTALYYAAIKVIRGEGSITANFFKSYRENLRQSVIAEILLLAAAYFFYVDLQIVFMQQGTLMEILRVLFLALLFVYLALAAYVFPLLARFVYTLPALFKNAFLMSMLNLPSTFLVLALDLAPAALFVLRPDWCFRLFPLLLFMVPGLTAYINSLLFLRIFRKYTPPEEEAAAGTAAN
ncbi:MAG: DUF624 domain-containing protein [Lachnospiraceae bacterium]|nr:DUF624 domain-containing protein [Lachnospiraceae bacterium]